MKVIVGMSGSLVQTTVTGPLGKSVQSSYGLIRDEQLAIIEIASACGLTLLTKEELNPKITTTYGMDELINHAYDEGARKFIIGLGGGFLTQISSIKHIAVR